MWVNGILTVSPNIHSNFTFIVSQFAKQKILSSRTIPLCTHTEPLSLLTPHQCVSFVKTCNPLFTHHHVIAMYHMRFHSRCSTFYWFCQLMMTCVCHAVHIVQCHRILCFGYSNLPFLQCLETPNHFTVSIVFFVHLCNLHALALLDLCMSQQIPFPISFLYITDLFDM